jgi:microcystin-dependent protein
VVVAQPNQQTHTKTLKYKLMKTLKLLIILSLLGFTAKAQVGVNTLDPDTTAILHIYSNTKGVLLPILDSNERAPLTAPAADGLLVYDSIEKIYYFFNRKTKEWTALNPFQTKEKNSTETERSDVRLADRFNDRNVVIGKGDADVDAKLHVKGNIKSTDSVIAKNARMNGVIIATNANIAEKIDAKNAHISDSTWSKKIGADSIKATTANITTITASIISSNSVVPVGAIVMWDSAYGTWPDCWAEVTGMKGRFPVGAGAGSDIDSRTGLAPTYQAGSSMANNRSGEISVAISEPQMPRHTHSLTMSYGHRAQDQGSSSIQTLMSSYDASRIAPNTPQPEYTGGSTNTQSASNGVAHENRPPFYGIYFIKKIKNTCP